MKSFRRLSLLAVAVAALASAAHFVRDAGEFCIAAVTRGARWLFGFDTPVAMVGAASAEPEPKVQLVQAAAFRLGRLIRRERVEAQPTYRRCPSV